MDGVISMLKNIGTGSEVTREIWGMKLLTLLPTLELGSSGTSGGNANRVIWKPCFARVCDTCRFGGSWLRDHRAFVVYGLQVPPRFSATGTPPPVSANPWNVVHFVLWVTATQLLVVFFENMYLSAEELFPVVFHVLARVLAKFPCSPRRLWGILGCVHRRCPSPVILQCSEFLVHSFEDQVGLGLSPCLTDKYLWEHVQIYLVRDDLLCLRVVARFHAVCEWFGPGWTVALSPLVHVVRRPAWDQSQDLPRFLWSLDT